MVVVSAGHVGGTRGSGIVSSAADVLWMFVVSGMRGVGGVVSGGEDWVWDLPILWEQGECWTCVCVLVEVVWMV